MVIYLYGPDSYRRTLKVKELLAANKKKQPHADVKVIDFAEDADAFRAAKEFLEQPSMFSDSKTLVVYETGEVNEKQEKAWLKLLKEELKEPKTIVIISDSWAKPRKAFLFLTEAPAKAQLFEGLEGRTLSTFLKKEADARSLAFQPEAWTHFVNFVSTYSDATRSWVGVRELEKLWLAKFAQPIAPKDLKTLIDYASEAEVFSAARALMGAADPKKRLALLEELLAQGEEPARLFNLLAYNARGAQAVRLADLDIAVKSGNAEYEEALLDFALQNG